MPEAPNGSIGVDAAPQAHTEVALLHRVSDLRAQLDGARAAGLSVGLVPTMGSLHQGHLSLLRRAVDECDVVAVTVFVNPLQFAPGEDLATYPHDLDADVEMVARGGGHVVFAPSVAEMYPTPATAPIIATSRHERLTEVLEGHSRRGHFAGVATAVARLFHAAGPCRAYFGEKDWQQLLVVRHLVDDLGLPVQVVACPTVRDPDGLACSSRNVRLASAERRAARSLSEALVGAAALIEGGERDPTAVWRHLTHTVARASLIELDYAAVVRAEDLSPLDRLAGEVRLLMAVRVGTTRLIDNVGVAVEPAIPTQSAARRDDQRRSA